jgi:hypothetical protein
MTPPFYNFLSPDNKEFIDLGRDRVSLFKNYGEETICDETNMDSFLELNGCK